MNDTAAHLVLPFAPCRQWVLSMPFRLRLLLAKNVALLGRARAVFMKTVRTFQRLQARRLGLRNAQTAAGCFTQRFGSRLDTSPHFHALVPEAVFVENADGSIDLRRLPKPRPEEIAKLVERIAADAGDAPRGGERRAQTGFARPAANRGSSTTEFLGAGRAAGAVRPRSPIRPPGSTGM
jgi:hypothetical protein